MNKVTLIGRLTKAPTVKQTASETPYINFITAVERRFKDAGGNKITDFINCVAWRQTAVFLGSYAKKGNKIAVSGYIQTRKYEDETGNTVFVTEVIAEEVELLESPRPAEEPKTEDPPSLADNARAIIEAEKKRQELQKIPDDKLPFEL